MNFEAERMAIRDKRGNSVPIIRERGPVYITETTDPEPDYDGYDNRGDISNDDDDDEIYNLD